MRKNVAGQIVGIQMTTAADGSPFTGSVTVEVTIDGGTQTTGSVGSGACTHEGNGYHTYAPAQAETNGNTLGFTFHGTGAITATRHIETDAAADLIGTPYTGTLGGDTTDIGGIVDDIGQDLADLADSINKSLRLFTGTIGDTGNDATHLHLADAPDYGDDALNGYVISFSDESDGDKVQTRTITDWVASTKLATLDAALPVTPEDSTDKYTVLSLRYAPADDITAIKTVTDAIPFSTAGNVQADVQEINEATITGDGDGTPFDVA